MREKQLGKGQQAAILALVQERDEIISAIEELVELYAAKYGMGGATVQMRGNGLWLVLPPEAEDDGEEIV